ncbi:hypothetical protein CPB85DRAFT_1279465 [Mucidula mucida]|nr:hypothetical protein CPB85DRAFT_1279465 [Mucidula mucida]
MSWITLPLELKYAVVEELDDARALSQVNRLTYAACLRSLYKIIKLKSPASLHALLGNVPASYLTQTASITVDLPSNACGDLCSLLSLTPRLKSLTITSAGRLTPSILAVSLPHLHTLSLTHIDPQALNPLSERLVVAFCSSLPSLTSLTLNGVTRSALHAPPLFFPVVRNDDNIPPHPVFGTDLALPQILRIASLNSLVIRDTPLSDARWETVPVACKIAHVELDGPDADRVLARIGPSVQHVSLGVSAPPRAPCPVLTRLHTTPYFPPDSLAPTLSSPVLSSSPISRVDMECFADDLPDLCNAVSDFLLVRKETPQCWAKLERVDIRVLQGDDMPSDDEALEAMGRLIRVCTELKLSCDSLRALRKWPDGRLRARTV